MAEFADTLLRSLLGAQQVHQGRANQALQREQLAAQMAESERNAEIAQQEATTRGKIAAANTAVSTFQLDRARDLRTALETTSTSGAAFSETSPESLDALRQASNLGATPQQLAISQANPDELAQFFGQQRGQSLNIEQANTFDLQRQQIGNTRQGLADNLAIAFGAQDVSRSNAQQQVNFQDRQLLTNGFLEMTKNHPLLDMAKLGAVFAPGIAAGDMTEVIRNINSTTFPNTATSLLTQTRLDVIKNAAEIRRQDISLQIAKLNAFSQVDIATVGATAQDINAISNFLETQQKLIKVYVDGAQKAHEEGNMEAFPTLIEGMTDSMQVANNIAFNIGATGRNRLVTPGGVEGGGIFGGRSGRDPVGPDTLENALLEGRDLSSVQDPRASTFALLRGDLPTGQQPPPTAPATTPEATAPVAEPLPLAAEDTKVPSINKTGTSFSQGKRLRELERLAKAANDPEVNAVLQMFKNGDLDRHDDVVVDQIIRIIQLPKGPDRTRLLNTLRATPGQ